MERTVRSSRRLGGEVRVPGEPAAARRCLWLAAVSAGTSRIAHVPPGVDDTLAQLEGLGVEARRRNSTACHSDTVQVEGRGLRGLTPPAQVVDLRGRAEAVLPALAILAQQPFPCRVCVADPSALPAAAQLLSLLARTGTAASQEADGVLRLDGVASPAGADHPESDLPGAVQLGLLVAGLYGGGPTTVRQSPSSRDRADAQLRERGVVVEASRQGEAGLRSMTVAPGQSLRALEMDVAGDLARALPLLVAALSVRRADVLIRGVAVRPDNRLFVDLARQIGAELEIADNDDGSADLAVKGTGRLKATRVADRRAESLLDQVALLAVLATQTEGEFIIRDIASLRQGPYDFVDHLARLLRRVGAKVGEYPEGIVIDGGRPLSGARIDSRGHPGLAQAFAVAGLVAQGQMEIEDSECVDDVFPGFFDTLEAMTAKVKEKTR